MRAASESERIKSVYSDYVPKVRERWSIENLGNRLMLEERTRVERDLLAQHFREALSDLKVLDVGCGSGTELRRLIDWGASPQNLYGIDLLEGRISAARRANAGVDFRCGDASVLPYADETFDLVLLFTVFSSIQSTAMRERVASEIRRVLRPAGRVLWYDVRYPNPRNLHLRPVTTTQIANLFPDFAADLRVITVLPPLVRALGRHAARAYSGLASNKLLRTHTIGMLEKPAALPELGGWRVRALEGTDLETVARLHVRGFGSYFLSRAGIDFVREYYSAFLSAPGCYAFVVESAGRILGVVAGVNDSTTFYRALYRGHFAKLAAALVPRLVMEPEMRRDLTRRFRHVILAAAAKLRVPVGAWSDSNVRARLLAIVVDDRVRGHGLADSLVNALCGAMSRDGIEHVGLSVQKGNARAIAFYKRNGWVCERVTDSGIYFAKTTAA